MKFKPSDKDFSIWLSNNISKMAHEYSQKATNGKCYICDKNCTSYCNSHSIPQFILNSLGSMGEYSNFADIAEIGFLKPYTGKNNAGTFSLICNNCDSAFFALYETKDLYDDLSKPIPSFALTKIAIKNHLYLISKANEELSSCTAQLEYIKREKPEFLTIVKDKLQIPMETACARIKMYENNYRYDKYYHDKNISIYETILQLELPYTVPIALQLAIPVHKGISGEIINTFEGEILYMLNVCIFPFKAKSLILMFSHISNGKYNQFKKDLQKLSLDEQLKIINFMIFQYSEDFYCNQVIMAKAKQNASLVKLCQKQSISDLSCEQIIEIPNILCP